MPWVEATFRAKRNTFVWYRGGTRRLSKFQPIASARLDQVTGEKIARLCCTSAVSRFEHDSYYDSNSPRQNTFSQTRGAYESACQVRLGNTLVKHR